MSRRCRSASTILASPLIFLPSSGVGNVRSICRVSLASRGGSESHSTSRARRNSYAARPQKKIAMLSAAAHTSVRRAKRSASPAPATAPPSSQPTGHANATVFPASTPPMNGSSSHNTGARWRRQRAITSRLKRHAVGEATQKVERVRRGSARCFSEVGRVIPNAPERRRPRFNLVTRTMSNRRVKDNPPYLLKSYRVPPGDISARFPSFLEISVHECCPQNDLRRASRLLW
jgi:hypothetical protein